jgi:tRNA(fMet)-specific endonuclease VapC
MTHLLDTNVWIALLRGKKPLVATRYASRAPRDMVACSIVVGELCVGAARSAHPITEQAKVDALLAGHKSLTFDDTAARKYAEIRADLETRGLLITDLDMMIAAIALVHGLKLVTHNTGDFSRISALRLEDWEIP